MSGSEKRTTLTLGLSIVALATVWQALGTAIIGTLSTPDVSAILSAVVFGSAAVYCSLQAWATKRASAIRELLRERVSRMFVLLQNVMTAGVFVCFYFSLAYVPATTSSVIEAGIGPLVAAILTVRAGRSWAVRRYTFPFLTAAIAAVIAVLSLFTSSRAPAGYPVGVLLAVCAGLCGVGVVMCSMKLVARGFTATDINATRFHGAWLASATAAIVGGVPDDLSAVSLTLLVGIALGAAPLVVLQFGITRSQPLPTELVMSSLPALVFVSESIITQSFDMGIAVWMVALLVCAVFAVIVEGRHSETYSAPAPTELAS